MVKDKKFVVTIVETRVYYKTVEVSAPNLESAKLRAIKRSKIGTESQLLTGKTRIVQGAKRIKA